MYIVSRCEYFGDGKIWETYMEIMDKYVKRQVLVCEDETIGSNRKDKILGYFLVDSEINIDEMEDIDFVDKKDFELVWEKHINSFKKAFEEEKRRYNLGNKVEGKVEAIYPQGFVIDLCGAVGFCLKKKDREYKLNELGSFRVEGFDKKNLWIVLKSDN